MTASPALSLVPSVPSPAESDLPVLGDLCPAGLRALLLAGGVIFLIGANSGTGGYAAALGAEDTLRGAADDLARLAGVDVRHRLGPEGSLADALYHRGTHLDAGLDLETGKPLRPTVLVLRLAPWLVVHLSYGSRTKLSDKSRSNAVNDDVADAMWEHNAALVGVHEGTRMLRRPSGAATIGDACEALELRNHEPTWLFLGGKDARPPRPYSEELLEELWQIAKAGAAEVHQFKHRTSRHGIRGHVGHRFSEGHVAFGTGRTSLPGTDTAYLRTPQDRGSPARFLHVDEPASRPPLRLVVSGRLAELALQHKPAVDQATLVCWFLAQFGLPGWGYTECADYLIAHGYYTPALHRMTKSRRRGRYKRRTDDGRSLARNICKTILRHLEEYYTECIVLRSWDRDGNDLRIEGFRPARGYWLTRDDYDRIRAFEAQGRQRVRHQHGCLFAGWPVLTPHGPGRLRTVTIRGELCYRVELVRAGSDRSGRRSPPLAPLTHIELARSLVIGLLENREALWMLLATVTRAHGAAGQARMETLRQERKELARQQASFQGKWAITEGDAYKALKENYNQVTARLRNVDDEIALLEADRRSTTGPLLRGVALGELLQFIASIRNPDDLRYRAAFLDGAAPLRVGILPPSPSNPAPPVGQPPSRQQTWSGAWSFHDDQHSWLVPFTGTKPFRQPEAREAREAARGAALFQALSAGTPWRELVRFGRSRWAPVLRHTLGIRPGAYFPFPGVDDPRVLRVLMAVVFPPLRRPRPATPNGPPRLAGRPLPRSRLADLAIQLGEPVALLHQVHDLYVRTPPRGRPQWLHPPNGAIAAAFNRAARTGIVRRSKLGRDFAVTAAALADSRFAEDWDVGPDELRLRPCPHCGHQRRIPLRIPEAQGPVCSKCRRDRAGVLWPANPYDRYRDRGPAQQGRPADRPTRLTEPRSPAESLRPSA